MKYRDWLSCFGYRKTLFIYHVNCYGSFFILFDISMDILHGKFISGKYGDMHHTKFLTGKGSFTTVKHNDKFAGQRTFDWLSAAVE